MLHSVNAQKVYSHSSTERNIISLQETFQEVTTHTEATTPTMCYVYGMSVQNTASLSFHHKSFFGNILDSQELEVLFDPKNV